MQRDVKIGIAIGVLLIGLIAIFWMARGGNNDVPKPVSDQQFEGEALPHTDEPTLPAGGQTADNPGGVRVGVNVDQTAVVTTTTIPAIIGPVAETPANNAARPVRTHTIAANETLTSISEKYYGTTTKWKKIHEANLAKIPNPDRLPLGLVIVIPDISDTAAAPPVTVPANAASASSAERTHTVVAGDTLSKISRKYYGTDAKWRLIYQANRDKMKSEDDLPVGIKLVIPAER